LLEAAEREEMLSIKPATSPYTSSKVVGNPAEPMVKVQEATLALIDASAAAIKDSDIDKRALVLQKTARWLQQLLETWTVLPEDTADLSDSAASITGTENGSVHAESQPPQATATGSSPPKRYTRPGVNSGRSERPQEIDLSDAAPSMKRRVPNPPTIDMNSGPWEPFGRDQREWTSPVRREAARYEGAPGELEDDRPRRVQLVEPPKEKEQESKPKGILKPPRAVPFPEDPNPTREGVPMTTKEIAAEKAKKDRILAKYATKGILGAGGIAMFLEALEGLDDGCPAPAPLKEAGKKGIPPGASWTKISRQLVNPAALEASHERFEEFDEYVVVLRVLTREEIEEFAALTAEIRGKWNIDPKIANTDNDAEAREREWQEHHKNRHRVDSSDEEDQEGSRWSKR
jgi:hypothetical protein